jgi:hypothetical protein
MRLRRAADASGRLKGDGLSGLRIQLAGESKRLPIGAYANLAAPAQTTVAQKVQCAGVVCAQKYAVGPFEASLEDPHRERSADELGRFLRVAPTRSEGTLLRVFELRYLPNDHRDLRR